MTVPPLAPTDSLALTVCRLALDPATGRLRHRARVGVAVRAALFAELALAGRIGGTRFPSPAPDGIVGEPVSPMAETLCAAVAARAPTHWKRWFSHTGADADAAVRALVGGDALAGDAGVERPDRRADDTSAQAQRVAQLVQAAAQAPSPAAVIAVSGGAVPVSDAVVALLATAAGLAGGRPRPRAALRRLPRLLPPSGGPDAAAQDTVRAAVRHGLTTIRGRSGSRLLSG